MSKATLHPQTGLVTSVITQNDLKEIGGSAEELSGAINIIGNIVLIPRYGIIGAWNGTATITVSHKELSEDERSIKLINFISGVDLNNGEIL